jgi:hypothetical protein
MRGPGNRGHAGSGVRFGAVRVIAGPSLSVQPFLSEPDQFSGSVGRIRHRTRGGDGARPSGRRECDCRMVRTPHHSPSPGRACSACPGKTTDLSDRSEWVGPGQQGKARASIEGDSEAGHSSRIGSLVDKRMPPRARLARRRQSI